MKQLNNPDKAETAKEPELAIIDIEEVIGWDRNIQRLPRASALPSGLGLAPPSATRLLHAVDAALAYLGAHFNNDPNYEIAFISETGSGKEFDLVGYDLRRIWQAAKAAQKRLSEWSTVDPQTAKRQAEVSDLVSPLYELVNSSRSSAMSTGRSPSMCWPALTSSCRTGLLRHQPTDRSFVSADRSSRGVTAWGSAPPVARNVRATCSATVPYQRLPTQPGTSLLQTKWPAGI